MRKEVRAALEEDKAHREVMFQVRGSTSTSAVLWCLVLGALSGVAHRRSVMAHRRHSFFCMCYVATCCS